MSKPSSAVVVENLVKRYEDVTALDDLSLQVQEGELYGMLGPNGAGKTTTINILAGLTRPTAGSARVGGYDVVKEAKRVREIIGVCPQDTAVYDYLTGRENVELFGSLHGMQPSEIKSKAEELLAAVGFEEDADRRVGKYSGGMRRRINLVMALVHDPKIVFLDEPTVAMDPQSRHAVWDFLLELGRTERTVVLTTHYMEEAEALCGTVGIIDNGKLIASGSPRELKEKHEARNLEEVFLDLTGRKIREAV